MRKIMIAAAATLMLAGVAGCESSTDKAAEKQADAIENQGEAKADALEAQAAATGNEAQETALNNQADATEQAADRKADMVEQKGGNADGGATTANTPSTH